MSAVVLKDGLLVQGYDSPRVGPANVLLRDGLIASIGDGLTTPPGAEVIDCAGCVVLPGHVCAHNHLYSALARGMPGPKERPTSFLEILERVWWRLDRALDAESLRASAFVGLAEALLAGTTMIVDHHESPSFIDGSLNVLADVAEELGVRVVLCYGASDRHGDDDGLLGVAECRRFLGALREDPRALIRGMLGAHASFTVGNRTLRTLAEVARRHNAGFHIHVAEDAYDEESSLEVHGVRVVQRLAAAGLLGPRTLLAHGVHLADAERRTIRAAGAWVVHNPRSNRNNRVGHATCDGLDESKIALGTDGIGSDMFAELRHAFYGLRAESDGGAEQAYTHLAAGRRLASILYGVEFDASEGAAADLIVLEHPTPTPLHDGNLPWQLVFSFSASHVRDVLVAGRPVVRNRRLQSASLAELHTTANDQAQRLWRRVEEF